MTQGCITEKRSIAIVTECFADCVLLWPFQPWKGICKTREGQKVKKGCWEGQPCIPWLWGSINIQSSWPKYLLRNLKASLSLFLSNSFECLCPNILTDPFRLLSSYPISRKFNNLSVGKPPSLLADSDCPTRFPGDVSNKRTSNYIRQRMKIQSDCKVDFEI